MCDLNKNPNLNKINHKNKSFNSFITNLFSSMKFTKNEAISKIFDGHFKEFTKNYFEPTIDVLMTQKH